LALGEEVDVVPAGARDHPGVQGGQVAGRPALRRPGCHPPSGRAHLVGAVALGAGRTGDAVRVPSTRICSRPTTRTRHVSTPPTGPLSTDASAVVP
jgi:hypothetical protein